ncbi:hypothetical protein DFJ73DRAFT_121961 [Zopfochytrium polystomum]|nr:hypothetical protein DFJ73DRAFT_121961 [Zopfochytrium polystomum]
MLKIPKPLKPVPPSFPAYPLLCSCLLTLPQRSFAQVSFVRSSRTGRFFHVSQIHRWSLSVSAIDWHHRLCEQWCHLFRNCPAFVQCPFFRQSRLRRPTEPRDSQGRIGGMRKLPSGCILELPFSTFVRSAASEPRNIHQ